jgi:hypothetical protein
MEGDAIEPLSRQEVPRSTGLEEELPRQPAGKPAAARAKPSHPLRQIAALALRHNWA